MRSQPGMRRNHWQRVRRFSLLLLAIWFVVTFLSIWFARELAGLVLFGWPLSFYMAAQGAILVYVSLIGWYAWRMDRLDEETNARSEDAA